MLLAAEPPHRRCRPGSPAASASPTTNHLVWPTLRPRRRCSLRECSFRLNRISGEPEVPPPQPPGIPRDRPRRSALQIQPEAGQGPLGQRLPQPSTPDQPPKRQAKHARRRLWPPIHVSERTPALRIRSSRSVDPAVNRTPLSFCAARRTRSSSLGALDPALSPERVSLAAFPSADPLPSTDSAAPPWALFTGIARYYRIV